MSLDGGCDGNNGHAAGGGGGIALGTAVTMFPANLMDCTDDLLAGMFRLLAVEHDSLALQHDSLAFFVRVKLVNRRVMCLIKNQLHAEYLAALHALACLVPGTRIPCGAANVMPIPSPMDSDETMQIYNDNMVLAPNGLEVGGIFNHHDWVYMENAEMEAGDDGQRVFMLLVGIFWSVAHIYDPQLVLGDGMSGVSDVSRLPNNIRSSMGHLDLTMSYNSERGNKYGHYHRFVRVRADTTMQKVFDAITFVEGWNTWAYMISGNKKLDPDVDVLELFENDVPCPDFPDYFSLRVQIRWPPVSIGVGRVLEESDFGVLDSDSNDSDEHVSGDSQDKSGERWSTIHWLWSIWSTIHWRWNTIHWPSSFVSSSSIAG